VVVDRVVVDRVVVVAVMNMTAVHRIFGKIVIRPVFACHICYKTFSNLLFGLFLV